MLAQWKFDVYVSMSVLSLNLLIDLRGIMTISDKMTQETNDLKRRQMARKL